jgi:hypothetical protein
MAARGPRFALLLAVDDATGAAAHALFRPVEDARGYFLLLEEVVRRHGIPLAVNSDRHGVFRAPAQQREGRAGTTQFARALRELGITLIFARSPQAMGRVERAAGTFQDRLVSELSDALGVHHPRGPGGPRALPGALQRPLPGPGGRA